MCISTFVFKAVGTISSISISVVCLGTDLFLSLVFFTGICLVRIGSFLTLADRLTELILEEGFPSVFYTETCCFFTESAATKYSSDDYGVLY